MESVCNKPRWHKKVGKKVILIKSLHLINLPRSIFQYFKFFFSGQRTPKNIFWPRFFTRLPTDGAWWFWWPARGREILLPWVGGRGDTSNHAHWIFVFHFHKKNKNEFHKHDIGEVPFICRAIYGQILRGVISLLFLPVISNFCSFCTFSIVTRRSYIHETDRFHHLQLIIKQRFQSPWKKILHK